MLGSKWVRAGLIAFVAILGVAWISKPKSMKAEIEQAGFHLIKVDQLDHTLPQGRHTQSYSITVEEKKRMIAFLPTLGFELVNQGGITGPELWFNRTQNLVLIHPYQHVFISNGPNSQLEFEPELR